MNAVLNNRVPFYLFMELFENVNCVKKGGASTSQAPVLNSLPQVKGDIKIQVLVCVSRNLIRCVCVRGGGVKQIFFLI